MARQLLQDRTPAAYAGVEAYARRHASEDAGALAWLVVGYAHVLDKDYAKAESTYRLILKTEPTNRDVIKELASVLFRQQRYEEAAAVLKSLPPQ